LTLTSTACDRPRGRDRRTLAEATITAENDSEEHLIPNALGGRRKVSGFLCRDCNSATGESWDAEVAEQLLPLCLLLDISRERGDPPGLRVVTSAGERLTIGPSGTLARSAPVFTRTPSPSGKTHYHVEARTMHEARQILMDLKRKHPEIDVDATLARAQMVETYPRGAVGHDLSIGGELAGRSMVKSSLAWAFANGVDWAACEGALSYLRANGAPPLLRILPRHGPDPRTPGWRPAPLPFSRGRHCDRPDPWLWRIFGLPSLCLPSWQGISRTPDR
jgi:hypothetical protein